MSHVSSATNEARNLRKPKIADQLLGSAGLDPSVIVTIEDLQDMYRIRHDLIHAMICEVRGLPFGEKTIEQTFEENKVTITNNQHYDLIKKQTPDYVGIFSNTVFIFELSISRSSEMEMEKVSKYSLLMYFFKQNGFKVNPEILIINPDSVMQQRDSLISKHKLNDPIISEIKDICDRFRSLESLIKSTPDGSDLFLQFYKITDDRRTPLISIDEVMKIADEFPNKITHDASDLKTLLTGEVESHITVQDDRFIDHCCELAINCKSSLMVNEKPDFDKYVKVIEDESKRYNGELQTKLRSIFPLPYIKLKGLDASIRTTETDLESTAIIAAKMMASDDPVMIAFGKSFNDHSSSVVDNDTFPFKCRLSKSLKREIALEGPERKQYAKRPDLYPEHYESQKKHSLYSLSYSVDVSDLERVSFLLSEKERIPSSSNIYSDSEILADIGGLGLDYVRVCQTIFREININSLRSDRRKHHILKPTGIRGVFVLIFKGPKLRVGEMPSQVWFKVIVDRDVMVFNSEMPEWIFKRMIDSKKIHHSRWLSVDAHRLDHYLRCYDKILMAYYSLCIMKYRSTYVVRPNQDPDDNPQTNTTLIESINNDSTNTLGLVIMTYMEDKRATSKLLQNVRYLVMTSISMYKYYESVLEKCLEPIRSPLQLYFLKKMFSFTSKMSSFNPEKNYKYGAIRFDQTSKTFMESQGGAQIILPRPIITDKKHNFADFSEILSEMYFTMLFNKNQDDPTHSSFQILSKMLEGEESMKEMKENSNHLGYRKDMSDTDWATKIVESKHAHQFSAMAIQVGSKLIREELGDKLGTDIKIASSRTSINKTLDQFATYKSSAVKETEHYEHGKIQQNKRRRCYEGVLELLDNKCVDSLDVADKYLHYPVDFQIFKKNQIGGVREILILSMISRVKINIIETLSRNICSFDKRETLTHGSIKNELIKEALYSSRRLKGKRMSLFFSMDKSRWGPSFVPCQFIYLFTAFKKQLGSFFEYIVSQMIIHQNKKCMLPERLIKAWALDEDNKLSHRKDARLQQLKEDFLKTKKLFFVNESNMGQGILHYTSSYLHAAMISFRNSMYSRLCDRLQLDHKDHFDLFSSDDSFTVFSLEIQRMSTMIRKIDIFMKCQEVSERLFNCSTSKSKSSINPIVGEFNSLFMSNMTFFPTLIKFSLAAVHPVNTDSFFRMVKESYASARQIVENGGTLDLYMVSQFMNKRYCEEIYHVGFGQQNDFRQYGIRHKPYHIGEYPIFNPTLMLMFGPEFHNYMLYKKINSLNELERKLFMNSHKIVKGELVEVMSELEEGETLLGGLLRIDAHIGPIRQYLRLKKIAEETIYPREVLESKILEDPLIVFRKERTLDMVKFRTLHKLFTPGAQEAVKTITASIYYGRVSASVSAKAFMIPNHNYETQTYRSCLEHLINRETVYDNLDDQIKFLYPKWSEYDLFIDEGYSPVPYRVRNIMEIQTIRTLSVFKVGTKLNNSILDVIQFMWLGTKPSEHEENKLLRDVQVLKTFYPMLKSTMQETLDQFKGERMDKIKSLILLLLKCYSLKDRTIKAIIYGSSTNDSKESYYVLSERNSSIAMTHSVKLLESKKEKIVVSYDELYLRYNHHILSLLRGYPNIARKSFDGIGKEIINLFMTDPSVGKNTKKRVFMPLLSLSKIDDIEGWTRATSTVLHYWEVRQHFRKDTKKWHGNFELILFMGVSKLKVLYRQNQDKYHFSKSDLEDPDTLYEFFKEFSSIMKTPIDQIIEKCDRGDWIIKDRKVLSAPKMGFAIQNNRMPLPVFNTNHDLVVNDDVFSLITDLGKPIMNIASGLINTGPVDCKLEDFDCYGLSFQKLNDVGAFIKDFDLTYKSLDTIRSLLDDLDVQKPAVSTQTKVRLKLKDDWNIKPPDKDDVEIEIASMEALDPIEGLLMDDEDVIELKNSVNWEVDSLMNFVQEFGMSDFFTNMTTTVDVQFPKRNLSRIKHLKYDCVALLCTTAGQIDRKTISMLGAIIVNERTNILYSVISRYDRLVAHTGVASPDSISFKLDKRLYELGMTAKDDNPIFD